MRRIGRQKRRPKRGAAKVATVGTVRRLIRGSEERKYLDTKQNGLAIDSIGTFYSCLSLVPQGITDVNRAGDGLTMKSLKINLFTEMNDATLTANAHAAFRLIVFQWHPEVDATFATLAANLPLAQILNTGSTAAIVPDSMYQHDRRTQYTILADKHWTQIAKEAVQGQNKESRHYLQMFSVPLAKARKQVRYLAGSTVVAMDHICIFIITYANLADDPVGYMTARLEFTDA